jgi:RNA polymerase sigma-70 factor (ECF subfamily)
MAVSTLSAELLCQLKKDPEKELASTFVEHQARVARLVELKLDHRLYGRVGIDDVLQEAYLNAVQRVHHYLAAPNCSLFVWIRGIVLQTMVDLHRHHLGTQKRDASRQTIMRVEGLNGASSLSLLASLAGSVTSPSRALRNEEFVSQIEQVLGKLSADDREVLMMRHFEDLTNSEVAEILHLSAAGASLRYTRALARLQDLLADCPELLADFQP